MQDNNSWMTTATICDMLEISARTLERYRKRGESDNPFPEPDISNAGASNKWYRYKVTNWQQEETKIKRAKPFAKLHAPRDERGRLIPQSAA
ncbi:excisionase Xis [Hafnia alvei]|uniref:excisionase Xis n=1 Tax=Hafnia alvei TaxID=569 RepID=UPI002DB57FD9|nr:excisionase Xis [Hafnia alvei]MEB7891026.1 excisionase Xis [Hafnia alvei]